MNCYIVKFKGSEKEYRYKTNLDLLIDGTYKFTTVDGHTYDTPVTVTHKVRGCEMSNLRQIGEAKLLAMPPRPKSRVKFAQADARNGKTVVIWDDGTKTIVQHQYNDGEFDVEKAIAMAHMKRLYGNRGAFNDVMRDILREVKIIKRHSDDFPKLNLRQFKRRVIEGCKEKGIEVFIPICEQDDNFPYIVYTFNGKIVPEIKRLYENNTLHIEAFDDYVGVYPVPTEKSKYVDIAIGLIEARYNEVMENKGEN